MSQFAKKIFCAASLLTLALAANSFSQSWQNGWVSRYWDACKVHCNWTGNAGSAGVAGVCNASNASVTPNDGQASACSGGPQYVCWDHSPAIINDNLAYGFVATPPGFAPCGTCYEFEFTGSGQHGSGPTHQALSGKRMIVAKTNIGGDVNNNQFDLLVPGGGLGIHDAFSNQIGVSTSQLGAQYGGLLTKCTGGNNSIALATAQSCLRTECNLFTNQILKDGCLFYANWMMAANNPSVRWREVTCPAELTAWYKDPKKRPSGSGTSSAGGVSSSSRASSSSVSVQSSSSSRSQATTCANFIGTLPANPNPPANPYTACFRHTNNLCYVCKVESETSGNTCASTWVWNGSAVAENLSSGYWYQAVTCPATSSSSVAASSSSLSSSSVAASSSSLSSSSVAASSSSLSSSSIAASSSSGGSGSCYAHPLSAAPSNPKDACFNLNGVCYKCAAARAVSECESDWLWTNFASGNIGYWYELTSCGSGIIQPSSSSGGSVTSSSSGSLPSSSSVGGNVCLQHPLQPYGTVPSNPNTACLRAPDDKCYVCPSHDNCSAVWYWGGDWSGTWPSQGWVSEANCATGAILEQSSSSSECASGASGSVTVSNNECFTFSCNGEIQVRAPSRSDRRLNMSGSDCNQTGVLVGDSWYSICPASTGAHTLTYTSNTANVQFELQCIGASSSSSAEAESSSSGTVTPVAVNIPNANVVQVIKNGVSLQAINNATLEVFNLKGNSVRRLNLTSGTWSIQFGDLPKGLYLVKISFGSERKILRIPVN